MPVDLKEEFQWYLEHQDELVEKYNGKVLVIKDRSVAGVYESLPEAYHDAKKNYDPGTYQIQKCSPGDKDYTGTFHSRVAAPIG